MPWRALEMVKNGLPRTLVGNSAMRVAKAKLKNDQVAVLITVCNVEFSPECWN